RSRFHDHFLDLFSDQPLRQSAQVVWTGSHFPPLELVFPLHGYICDDHGQHSLVHIDPGNSVRHFRLLPEGERMPKMKLFRVSGYCCVTAITAPTCSLNNACAGPANLSASTSPLDVRSPCSGHGESRRGTTRFS